MCPRRPRLDLVRHLQRRDGRTLPEQRGAHVYVFVKDGSDIDRMQVYYPPGPGFVRFPEPKRGTLADLREVASWWYVNCPAPKRRYT